MENNIELKNVSKKYKDFELKDISFNVPQGCIVGLIGENGAGKTTTIKSILNITKAEGDIKIFGKDNKKDEKEIKEKIGVVLEDSFLSDYLTAKQINSIMKDIYEIWDENKYRNLLKQFNLPTNKLIKDFSSGMKMKLKIATAISHNSKVLILDEPTSGLDPVVRNEILDIFRKYVEEGADVYMCHVANGNMGHVEILPEPLREIRTIESEAAGKIIGAKKVFNLDVGDVTVTRFDNDVVDAMADVVREVRPDVIITHNDEDYMQDHVETSRIAFNGSFVSSLAHKSVNFAAYDEFVPIYFMDTLGGVNFIPTHYVDITNQIETKLEALKKHESQIKWMFEHDHIDFIDMIRTCSRYRGYQSGVTYAEGFRPCTVYPRMTTKHLLP